MAGYLPAVVGPGETVPQRQPKPSPINAILVEVMGVVNKNFIKM